MDRPRPTPRSPQHLPEVPDGPSPRLPRLLWRGQQGSEGHLFGITSVDRNDLKATQHASGIPVALLFWNRLAYGRFEYRICLLDDLLVPHTDDKGTEWLCRDFPAEELTTTRLAAS